MTAVLGIDAAWTKHNPSGFALIEKVGAHWRLRAAASNIEGFARDCGMEPANEAGLDFAIACAERALGGRLPELIAVDMPLSRNPIVGRRASDIGVSRRFGAAKCATHSPSAARPGKVSDQLHEDCKRRGYRLKTAASPQSPLTLAEIYPHPALLRLMAAKERVPYKVAKTTRYWPDASSEERLLRVRGELQKIARRLDEVIAGVLPLVDVEAPQTFSALKAAEDMIDAIVSAWIGTTILENAAEAFGDEDSAIWVPRETWAIVHRAEPPPETGDSRAAFA
jgi:predicted RNase H-like nuclease